MVFFLLDIVGSCWKLLEIVLEAVGNAYFFGYFKNFMYFCRVQQKKGLLEGFKPLPTSLKC